MKLLKYPQLTFHLCVILLSTVLAEDFYELLNVAKGASTKEIRKAFKKIAVLKHPDKNTDDPKAHEEFVKINRAYEVLKDEELRKKYDMHGEEGLSDDFQGGRRYESWKFYQEEFGIYDDDPEIITLSKSDFELSIEGTDDVWFVNFYSPHCSHCHDLAPNWREMARELEGVIRVGAVNCGDDWHLCRMQGIHGYPSLFIYPNREKYTGGRSVKDLVKHALKFVRVEVHELWKDNFASTVTYGESSLPWLITFCGEGGDCLLPGTALKVAGMLEELANVGRMDCYRNNKELCENLGQTHGTVFYQSGIVSKGEGYEITSLVAQEITNEVLARLPDVTDLDLSMFQDMQEGLQNGQDLAWLVHFVEGGEGRHLELRKLPAMLPNLKVGRVDCQELRYWCNHYHVHKFPSFLIFKAIGGYEIYYGRATAHDVAAYTRDSSTIKLEALSPADFQTQRVGPSSNNLWFVDFFAPWCPPCMRLLPEFRKAARSHGSVANFGTVDCSIHTKLCQDYGVGSYPTTILYNQSIPHKYNGQHSAHSIVEFIEDTLSPPVVALDSRSFQREVIQKADDVIWMVDFFAPWCGPCQQLAPEWSRLAKMFKGNMKVKVNVGKVDCTEEQQLCASQQVSSYPTILLFPPGTGHSGSFHQFNNWNRDADTLRSWAYDFFPTKVTKLTWRKFQEQVINSQQPWVIDFFAPWCGPCKAFAPEFEIVAHNLEGKARAGKVDCTAEQGLCQQVGIRSYPSVRLFRGVPSPGQSQDIHGMDLNSQNAEHITQFVKNHIPNQKHVSRDEL